MPRHAVRRSFDRAAESYDTAAGLQRQVCKLLIAAVATEIANRPAMRILDAGCGTGYALGMLAERWPDAEVLAADFAEAMIAAAGGAEVLGVCTDVHALPFPPASFDLYWSSLTLQWCDPFAAVAEAARVLAPGGLLAVSSLAPGTLAELDAAFAGLDDHRHVLEFSPPDALRAACAAAGLAAPRIERRRVRMHYPDLPALLRGLKALGANQVGHGGSGRRRGLLGRRTWQAIETRYEAHRDADGLPATFEVILCTASKPGS